MAKKSSKKAVKKTNAKTTKSAVKKASVKKTTPKKAAAKAAPAKKTKPKAKVTKAVAKPTQVSNGKKANKAVKTAKKVSVKPIVKTNEKKVNLVSTKKTSKIDFKNWVTPLDDRILVQIASEERVTPGGLFIPDTVADVSGNFKGHVVAVGRGHLDKKGKVRPLDVKTGDVVVFSQFSGSEIEYQGEKVIFIRESDVLGIVNK